MVVKRVWTSSSSSNFMESVFWSSLCDKPSARAAVATISSFMTSLRSTTCVPKRFCASSVCADEDRTKAFSPSSFTSKSDMVLVMYCSKSCIHSLFIELVLAKSSSCAFSNASCLKALTFSSNSVRSARISTCLSIRSTSNWVLKVVNWPCNDGFSVDDMTLGDMICDLVSAKGKLGSEPSCWDSLASTTVGLGEGAHPEGNRPPPAGSTSLRQILTLDGVAAQPALSAASIVPPLQAPVTLSCGRGDPDRLGGAGGQNTDAFLGNASLLPNTCRSLARTKFAGACPVKEGIPLKASVDLALTTGATCAEGRDLRWNGW
mmetsp:Transcript_36974/g.85299  ORF Transcript_36974/g.85299 Transcript_36974/m.85299 type:complete len:319 (-) Transcript_36974:413-1369(-)